MKIKGNGRTKTRKPTKSHGVRSHKTFVVRCKGGKIKVRCTEGEHAALLARATEGHRKLSSYFVFDGKPFLQWDSKSLQLHVRAVLGKNGLPKYMDVSDYVRQEVLGLDTDK